MRLHVAACLAGLLALPSIRQSAIASAPARVEREPNVVAAVTPSPGHVVEIGRDRPTATEGRWTPPRHQSIGGPVRNAWRAAATVSSPVTTEPNARGCAAALVCGYRATAPPVLA